jgi:hypothetical protein
LRFEIQARCVTKESALSQSAILLQMNSSQFPHVSIFFFKKQHMSTEHEGCLSKKPTPAQPGHFDLPTV